MGLDKHLGSNAASHRVIFPAIVFSMPFKVHRHAQGHAAQTAVTAASAAVSWLRGFAGYLMLQCTRPFPTHAAHPDPGTACAILQPRSAPHLHHTQARTTQHQYVETSGPTRVPAEALHHHRVPLQCWEYQSCSRPQQCHAAAHANRRRLQTSNTMAAGSAKPAAVPWALT
jgi:hypothetical protein